MTAIDDYAQFIKTSAINGSSEIAIAFFVGYSLGSMGSREQTQALLEAFHNALMHDPAEVK